MNKRTLVSIDWDFFVPEKPEWDLGHQESEMFLRMLWMMRGHLIDQMKTSGEEKDFFRRLDLPSLGVTTSDSHAYAFQQLVDGGYDQLILFDTHHDCWGSSKDDNIMCHNWVRIWLSLSPKHKVIWVYPNPDVLEGYPLPKDLANQVKLVAYGSLKLQTDTVAGLHICRSGCWTPPWLDKNFIEFVQSYNPRRIVTLQDGVWNPMKERWTEQAMKEALHFEKMSKELIERSRNAKA